MCKVHLRINLDLCWINVQETGPVDQVQPRLLVWSDSVHASLRFRRSKLFLSVLRRLPNWRREQHRNSWFTFYFRNNLQSSYNIQKPSDGI